MIERLPCRIDLFEKISVGIVMTDTEGRIALSNPTFCAMTGCLPEEVAGRLLPSFITEPPVALAARPLPSEWHGEISGLRQDGTVFAAWLHLGVVAGAGGEPDQRIAVFNDLTALRVAETKLAKFADHDPLTGLPGRGLLLDRLEQTMAHARRKQKVAGLLLVDVDHFKGINDVFGFAAGNRVLGQMARRLLAAVRQDDTVARLGDDEFAVVVGELDAPGQALAVAEKMNASFAEPLNLDGDQEIYAAASIGVALYPMDGENASELIQNAGSALELAKHEARGSFRFFSPSLRAQAVERARIENDLHHALGNGELELHYQPKVSLRTGRIVGLEALARWHHPLLGLIGPDRFIPIADESGLIRPIGDWALWTACRQGAAWREDGLDIATAVNVSANQLHDRAIVHTVRRTLEETGLDPRRLEIEITESALMRDAPRAQKVLAELHDLGVRLSVDDFGTGYSSLAYLKSFPLHELKIDQSFIRNLPGCADDQAIVSAVTALAGALGLSCIAEGVETPEQRDKARALGCDAFQGYLCSRPVPTEEVAPLLLGLGVEA